MRKTNQLKIGVMLSYVSMIVQNIITIVYTPVMLRLLGQNEYGLYQLVYSVVSYLGLLNFGFGSAYVRFYSRYRVKDDQEGIAKWYVHDCFYCYCDDCTTCRWYISQ